MLWAAADRVLGGLAWPEPDASVLVACSGGLDSVVLLDVAVDRLGSSRVVVAHVDHGARPDSGADAAFVAELAARAGVRPVVRTLPPGPRDEASLRAGRLAALEAIRAEVGAAFVLLGHHRDDQAETVLIQAIRQGRPTGMVEVRDRWVRPFLRVPRRHLRAHALRRRLEWREDPSNRDPEYLRNRIRRELLPLIESRYRSGFARRLAALATEPRPIPRGPPPGPPPSARPSGPPAPSPEVGWRRSPHRGEPVPAGPDVAWFDADVVPELRVRPVRPGDRIQPFGMSGRKKVSEVLREHRVPRARRDAALVVVGVDGVLWVPGLVRSEVGRIRPETRDRWEIWCKWE